ILIYNILGQQQYLEDLTNIDSKIILSIPKLAKGTYFVKITNHSKRNTTTKKIIIR
ncbi:MAG: T9SS type A sorting domain-containing protein, partial [Flavobacteriaceae bacterium]|nr:T9SS type A sorting domain-containing protein [Flavobacteriaceae bacterium]